MVAKTVFVITVSTMRIVFPGISPTVDLPGQPASKNTPASRLVSIFVGSERPAGPDAWAYVRVPTGLGKGDRVTLEIERAPAAGRASDTAAQPDVAQKTYWGCSDSVPDGQPRDSAPRAEALRTGDVSFASWPTARRDTLPEYARAPGVYTLETSYTGATSVTLGDEQGFLGAVEPVTDVAALDFAKAMIVKWKPVSGAVGYLVTAFGGTDRESINWTSSADPDAYAGLEQRAIGSEEIEALLEKKVLLPPSATSCVIPEGVFARAKGGVIGVIAFGRDKIQDRNSIQTQVVVRSQLTVPIMKPG